MVKVADDYILGLDIGTNSCGWAVTDKQNTLLKLRGKTAIGSHLFEEGHSAADRRSFRTTRRRLKRRKWRLKLLEEIFAEPMAEVDENFFARLHQSWISPLDNDRPKYQAIVFPTPEEDRAFYQDYPTIYHLRYALMTEDKQFDLRAIFMAMHHIVKYRGNFLQDTPVKNFEASKIKVAAALESINSALADMAGENADLIKLKVANAAEIEKIIKGEDEAKTVAKLDKVKKITQLLVDPTNKEAKNLAKQLANALMGYKTRFEVILGKEIEKADQNAWNFKLSDEDADDKLDALLPELSDNEQTIIAEIKLLFGAITLSNIVDEGKSLSESMIGKYQQHSKDYRLLKSVVHSQHDRKKGQSLRLAYDLYVNNRHGSLLKAKQELGFKNVLNKEDFYKLVQKNVDDSEDAQTILQEIEEDNFMPKQRTSANGVIPFQLHQRELDQIIKMQSKYYPFLAEENPVVDHQKQAPYKLDELIRFRVPYYVGPMITPDDQEKTSGKSFAWMVRKADGAITPWNFEAKVDRIESANRFIKRMTLKDTYLLGEDVVPANSLLYQKYEVLNELNNIRINGSRLDVPTKQEIYEGLFKTRKTVTASSLITYLQTNHHLQYVDIKGLADPQKFNSSLASFYHLKNLGVFSQELDNPQYEKDFEQIIEWSTVFEDTRIFQEKLREITWLTPEQFKAISTWRLKGWGRLSRRLLVELHDQNGQNIMERLWDSQQNFMQIVNEPAFKAAIEKENQAVTKRSGVEDILADAYTSPANKKAIRQVVKVVDDVVKATGGKVPAQFAVEFTRNPDPNPKLTQIRGSKLLKVYSDTAKELVDQELTNNLKQKMESRQLAQDKYFLYFMQAGRDAYTGQRINIDEITTKYQIDHILPQSFVKDDSLDNRVLTASPLNAQKSDDVPFKRFGNKTAVGLSMTITQMWKVWQKVGLISKTKLTNLMLDPDHLYKYQKSGFIHRQLVETSQIIKLVAVILQDKYPDSEIITVKAKDNSALRKRLSLYKSREVNDYHHAIDAYLSAICGNFLYQVYPKLRPFFVYGQYQRFGNDSKQKDETMEKVKTFNFLWPLLQKDNEKHQAPEEIVENFTDHIVFYKHPDIFDKLRRAYNFKFMLVSRETTTEERNLFNMTVYPRAERDTAATRSLIPKGKGLNPAIYGGYSGNADAYMAIVKIEKAKDAVYKVVGVPMRALADLKQAAKAGNYDAVLKQTLTPLVMYDKKGKPKRGFKDFRILGGRVLYKQVVIDGDRKFMLYSSVYMANAKQLTLSPEAMRIVTDNFKQGDNIDQLLIDVYDEILTKVDRYLPLFDTNGFRRGLHNGREKFLTLEISEKKNTVKQILNGLHDNLVLGNLKNLGIKTLFGMMTVTSGITLSPDAKLLFQSPTGLFEKQVRITDL
ncbi:type II CRISPR RNA-guided endonuclease Cas9 [Lactobacillus xylocopicola]|uniref:CRISPR-associated endonuclease Cas9 n=1 Tax=Lactobacillus xylocopicola TaxID=2976676 RepID=A0ABM8BFJ5_9LACO|nr:type II CRISPR RNA-guided endonuclease Cas9 [Lactobacillus xylocopicola]BDR59986.1 CRISPR-associated endonuclease Cas9 [Lactobacillus xylocopicola]